MKVVKLICVTGENNNKYYNMTQTDQNNFEVKYGRVGGNETCCTYPMSKWNAIYKQKTGKGYKDVTEHFIEEQNSVIVETKLSKDFMDNRPSAVIEIVKRLQNYANKSIEENYTVTASKVSRKQVEKAQELLSSIAVEGFDKTKINAINDKLIELYHIIPRKMVYVPDYLIKDDNTAEEKFNSIMKNEQETLDVMAGQVKTLDEQKSNTDDTSKNQFIDIIEAAGLDITPVTDTAIIKMIKEKMQSKSGMFKQAFAVVNKNTQAKFDNHMKTVKNNYTELYWHGSRSENWWSIMQSGLLIRPSGAVYTGSMFGDGIYFASEFDKSLGYTSISGSRWAKGGKNFAFLALFEVHLGKQLKLTSSNSRLNKKYLKDQGDYDSTWGAKGSSLYRDEYIIYDNSQCTIKYLVEVEGSQY